MLISTTNHKGWELEAFTQNLNERTNVGSSRTFKQLIFV